MAAHQSTGKHSSRSTDTRSLWINATVPRTNRLIEERRPATARPPAAQRVAASTVELIKDVSVRLAPLTERDAREMIRSLPTFPLLDHPEISELDLNPVIVGTDGAVIVDARVRVEAPPPKRPSPSLGQ